FWRLLCKNKPNVRAILRFGPVRRVVNLKNELRSSGDLSGQSFRNYRRLFSWSVADYQSLRLHPLLREDDDVMNDSANARSNLGCLNPLVFGEVGRNAEVLVLDHARGRHRIFLWQIKHNVGLADVPAFQELRRWWEVFGVTFFRSLIHPSDDRVDVLLREFAVIQELAVMRIGVPRRHRPISDLLLYRTRPGPRVLISQQRHRRDLAGPMALHAVVEEDWRDVFRKSRLSLLCVAGSACESNDTERGHGQNRA